MEASIIHRSRMAVYRFQFRISDNLCMSCLFVFLYIRLVYFELFPFYMTAVNVKMAIAHRTSVSVSCIKEELQAARNISCNVSSFLGPLSGFPRRRIVCPPKDRKGPFVKRQLLSALYGYIQQKDHNSSKNWILFLPLPRSKSTFFSLQQETKLVLKLTNIRPSPNFLTSVGLQLNG